MKRASTLILKLAILFVGALVLTACVVVLYSLIKEPFNSDYAPILYPIIIGIYASVIPFGIALNSAFKILYLIDRGNAFSNLSVKALQHIKYCAVSISVIYVFVMPFVYKFAETDDAPGLVVFGTIPIFASFVIAVFAAVLQRLLHEAIEIKSENDLTI